MSTDTELQSEITSALLKQKDVIVKGLVDGAVASIQQDLGWRAGNIAGEVVNGFIKTDVLPALTAELEARKAEIVTSLVAGLMGAVDVAAKRMADQAAKNLASGWNLKKVTEAILS
jgi:hypothetical protein